MFARDRALIGFDKTNSRKQRFRSEDQCSAKPKPATALLTIAIRA
jgi:hypothetical protein